MKNILTIILSLISITLFAQNFSYKADVEKVEKNGFNKILLSPEITSKLNSNFYDIRIYDTSKVEIPYLLYKEDIIKEQNLFVEYKIIEKKHNRRYGYTRIVIHNPKKNNINNIVLRIKNADVRKRLKLNASNDNRNWYVLKDNYYYNSINSYENTSEIRVLNFPLSDYEYYELLIGDYYDKPINVLQAGFYNLIEENGKYSQLNNISYNVVDTLKETIIAIPINGNYIDKITFDIDTPKYYHRSAQLYIYNSKIYKKKKKAVKENIAHFNLVSNSGNVINLDNLQADTIYIKIKNNDDVPLKIKNIELHQLSKFLTAELSSENSYVIKFSDKKAKIANYDLKYFTNIIPKNLDVIKTNNIEKCVKAKKESKEDNLNVNNYWLWIIIIFVALLLGYMSYSMIKDKNK